nr:family 78 glycoside hydrolase catalytic domain [Nitrospira sp.]
MEKPTRIVRLRCEYLVDPLGTDERAPRLGWNLLTDRRGARQIACRVRVASSAENIRLGRIDLWDSGRVETSQTQQVVYRGRALKSRESCFWQVEVWDELGVSTRSDIASWTMGLLDKHDWNARWIAADPEIVSRDPAAIAPSLTAPGTPGIFRRGFDLSSDVRNATLYVSARGLVHIKANGRSITPDLFIPEWTDYDKRIHYRTYSVTDWLRSGRNWLEVTLGDGWWSGYVGWQETRSRYGSLENSFLLQLEMELTDGRNVSLYSDRSWQCHTGPILSSDFMMGEVYDARRGQDVTRLLTADASASAPVPVPVSLASMPWLQAREVPAPAAALVSQRSEPVRITEEITPVSRAEVSPGVHIYDLGQNISGWVRLTVQAPAGTRVQLRHAERLNPDGTLYTENLRQAKATDVYICRGDKSAEVYE